MASDDSFGLDVACEDTDMAEEVHKDMSPEDVAEWLRTKGIPERFCEIFQCETLFFLIIAHRSCFFVFFPKLTT